MIMCIFLNVTKTTFKIICILLIEIRISSVKKHLTVLFWQFLIFWLIKECINFVLLCRTFCTFIVKIICLRENGYQHIILLSFRVIAKIRWMSWQNIAKNQKLCLEDFVFLSLKHKKSILSRPFFMHVYNTNF